MPEGNEVHRYADLQTEKFAGKTITVAGPNQRFEDAAIVDGRKLQRIDAYGKHLLYDFGSNRKLHVHLGRFGKFREGAMPFPEPKGALRLRLSTKDWWVELRGPTVCKVITDEDEAKLLDRIGPDPLREDGKAGTALDAILRSKTPVGALLMDQSVISGIGNIYRAELLFRARLSPFRPGNEVPKKTLTKIWKEAEVLLAEGMVDRRIVTTKPADRPHSKGKAMRGETHYVYRRKDLPCFICSTKIKSKDFVGRTLFWCPVCQAE